MYLCALVFTVSFMLVLTLMFLQELCWGLCSEKVIAGRLLAFACIVVKYTFLHVGSKVFVLHSIDCVNV